MAIHKGTELNNVNETWQQNERMRQGREPSAGDIFTSPASTSNELDRTIKEEAAEYDNANKEDRILGGERATVNDDSDNV